MHMLALLFAVLFLPSLSLFLVTAVPLYVSSSLCTSAEVLSSGSAPSHFFLALLLPTPLPHSAMLG